jgi:hypothetical protein
MLKPKRLSTVIRKEVIIKPKSEGNGLVEVEFDTYEEMANFKLLA